MTVARVVIVAFAMLGCAGAADAAQCTVSATSVNFGAYNVFDTKPNDSTGTITLKCNGGAKHVSVGLSRGGTLSYALRFMKLLEPLFYNLYLDASRTVIWGDGSLGTQVDIIGDPPNNKNVELTVFGRIPAGQDVSAGSYSDTVTVIVNY